MSTWLLAEIAASIVVAHVVSELLTSGDARLRLSATIMKSPSCSPSAASTIVAVGGLLSLIPLSMLASAPTLVHRLALLIIGHTCVCVIEYWRRAPASEMRAFFSVFSRAILYVIPVYPLIAIVGSTLLLVLSSTLNRLDLGSMSRSFIDIASLHTPFFFVHFRVRFLASRLASAQILPFSDSAPTSSESLSFLRTCRLRRLTTHD